MNCQLSINHQPYSFEVEGDFFWGKDEVLFESHDTLFRSCKWINKGYSVSSLFSHAAFHTLYKCIQSKLQEITKEVGITFPSDISLDQYHTFVNTQELHQQVIEKTRFLTYKDFDFDFAALAQAVSEELGHPVSLHNPLLEKEIVILRISRPHSMDINPLHRDGYLDLWEDVVNLWIPIAGCNEHSSLPVITGSHLWNEKEVLRSATKGASINGMRYHVPGIVQTTRGLNLTRPNPQPGETLLFTPFLIHGAAINLNPDQTRMALELRFCNADKIR